MAHPNKVYVIFYEDPGGEGSIIIARTMYEDDARELSEKLSAASYDLTDYHYSTEEAWKIINES